MRSGLGPTLKLPYPPPVPKPPSVTTRKVLDPAKGCFRCLASNHRVAACRDPVRCRRCWASGHRSSRCKMKLGGILRAAARRLRTPAAARAARARSAPQGSNVSAPLLRAEDPTPTLDLNELPTTDFSFLCQEAYLPNNMVPSSSSGPSQPEVLGSERFEQPPLEQPCIDKFVSESPRLAPMGTLGTTPASSTPLLDAPGSAGLASLPVQAAPTLTASSAEEYASGELDSESDSSRSSWQGGRPRHAEAWVSPGRASLNERLLFAFIEPPVPMSEVSAFIRDALRTVAPLQPVDLLPSSLGAMLLRCESLAARDCLHRFTPVRLGGRCFTFRSRRKPPTVSSACLSGSPSSSSLASRTSTGTRKRSGTAFEAFLRSPRSTQNASLGRTLVRCASCSSSTTTRNYRSSFVLPAALVPGGSVRWQGSSPSGCGHESSS